MSLKTDLFFARACRRQSIIDTTHNRIFNTGRDEISEEEDKIPYIIITNDGTRNDVESKDDKPESEYDSDTVSVLVVSDTRSHLAELVEEVRTSVCDDVADMDEEMGRNFGFIIQDYTFTAGPVEYDPSKPCFFQTLTYNCETYNIE